MPTLWLDPDASAAAVTTWGRWGDELAAVRSRLLAELDDLMVPTGVAPSSLGHAADELRAAALYLQLVVDHVLAADDMALVPQLDAPGADLLYDYARARLATTTMGCAAFTYPLPRSDGDPGGTYGGEAREPWVLHGAAGSERGREIVMRALRDTATGGQIHEDEFQVVRMSDGRYLVVLPGVIDLSEPDWGLDDRHRSVRDLDQHAVPSSRSTGVDDNRYARMVADALAVRGVPVGSDLVIIGHSYGADTALDLAADGSFNGPGGYRVSHVVAAGYWVQPQLEHVPGGTEVLVLQNRSDVPVIVEAVGAAHVVDAFDARLDGIGSIFDLDPIGAIRNAGRSAYHDLGIAAAAIDRTLDHVDDLVDIGNGVITRRPALVVGGARDLVTLEPGVRTPRDGHVVAVFDGGLSGAGHHQHDYLAYLSSADDPAVTAFLASLAAGSTATGSAWSIDVSVP
jgi:hypothetical protein